MARHTDAWKNFERKIAKRLGGVRIPGSGVQREGPLQGDVHLQDQRFLAECKYRQAISVHRWWEETVVKAKKLGKIAVIFHTEARKSTTLVTLELEDFLSLVEVQGAVVS